MSKKVDKSTKLKKLDEWTIVFRSTFEELKADNRIQLKYVFAKEIGVSSDYLGHLLHDKNRNVPKNMRARIEQVLSKKYGVPIERFRPQSDSNKVKEKDFQHQGEEYRKPEEGKATAKDKKLEKENIALKKRIESLEKADIRKEKKIAKLQEENEKLRKGSKNQRKDNGK